MSKKISELDAVENIDGTEIVPVVSNFDNKIVTIDGIKDYISKSSKDYISIKDNNSEECRLYIINDKLKIIKEKAFSAKTPEEGSNKSYDGLIINQMYGGGDDDSILSPVSHSFIELYNLKDVEINLKGLYLWYKSQTQEWKSLELVGIIPPKHSFLIRCNKVTDSTNNSVRIPILEYDMEWDIPLSSNGFSIYLCIGKDTPEDNPVRKTMDATGSVVASENGRYIDLLGAAGKNSTITAYEGNYLDCMDINTGVRRVDFANSGSINIGSNYLAKGNNKSDCEPVDYSNCDPEKCRPKSLIDGEWDEFFDKDKQSESSPMMINISFDKDGTGRCFCFHTPVTTVGYVYYRKQGDILWQIVETTITTMKDIEGVTSVHKCKISNLDIGIYEYRCGYEGCWSNTLTFEVKNYSSSTQNINILWTTDQQSFTNREWDVWNVISRYLRQNNGYRNYDFHLNTGDISQNGNKSFEWKLYYKYASELTNCMPHMITLGNNDLVDKLYSTAYSNYIYEDDKFFTSVYAFDLGYTHFVCLNSNNDLNALKSEGGPYDSYDKFLQAEADWLDTHLSEVNSRSTKPRWLIIYSHLSPFTVRRTARLQRWISVIEKYKVDLFLCAHNHAYSRSKALYTGFDYNKSPAYNDYVTTISKDSTELKIVDEFKGDGITEINRDEDKANGTVYILSQATGFKLSGKEPSMTLPTNLQGTKHANTEGGPWWIAKQDMILNKDPMYCTLNIQYDKIEYKSYYVNGILEYDSYNNKSINKDLSKVSTTLFDSLTINYNERNK